MWSMMTVSAMMIEGLDAAYLVVWFRAWNGKWKLDCVYAYNPPGDFVGEVPIWSIPWNVAMEWETKALVGFGRPHP